MNYAKNFLEEILCRNLNKGEPIIKIGSSASGKSTFDSELAKSQIVSKMLQHRELSHRINSLETEIVVTDDKALPEDNIVIYFEVQNNNICNLISNYFNFPFLIAYLLDDNNFVENLLKESTDSERESLKRKISFCLSSIIRSSVKASDKHNVSFKMHAFNEIQKYELSEYIYNLLKTNVDRMFIDIYKKSIENKDINEKIVLISKLIFEQQKNEEDFKNISNKILSWINPEEEIFSDYLKYVKIVSYLNKCISDTILDLDSNYVLHLIYNSITDKLTEDNDLKYADKFINTLKGKYKIISDNFDVYKNFIKKMDNYMNEKNIYIDFSSDINNMKICILLKEEDPLSDYLLECGYRFKDFLINRMVLIYRGNEEILNKHNLTVMKSGSESIHLLRFIDTVGISNKNNLSDIIITTESERITETIKKYHANHIIYFSDIENVENIDNIIGKILEDSRKDSLTIYPIFTKLDKYISDKKNPRNMLAKDNDLDLLIKKIKEKKLEEIENLSSTYLDKRSKKSVKTKFYRRKEKTDIFLSGFFKEKNNYSYKKMINNLVESICSNMITKLEVYNIPKMNKSQLYSWSKLNNNDNEKSNAFKNIGELYYSLCECVAYSQGIYELPPLYINVCIDKWLNFGCSYKSNINKCYLFENVDTNFIDYIKEIPAKINNKIDIKTLFNLYGIEIYPTYDKETIDIPSDFDNFIKNNFTNRVGDYLAINIGKESFSKAYLKDKSIFKGVSNRFNDMIKYILITYFNSKQIDIENKNLINAINKSTSDYLQEIIDRKCILIDSFFK